MIQIGLLSGLVPLPDDFRLNTGQERSHSRGGSNMGALL